MTHTDAALRIVAEVPSTSAEVAAELGIPQPNASTLLRRMCARGQLTRKLMDRDAPGRRAWLYETPKVPRGANYQPERISP